MVDDASTFVVSLTPFTAEGALDEAGLRAHLRRLRNAGIGVYVGGSGSGEGYTLNRDERRRVFEVAHEELAGRVPVRAMGVEPRTAAEATLLAGDAAASGLDAAQLYPLDLGHGYAPRRPELEAYLFDVLEAVTSPVVVASHQSVGYRYPVDLLAGVVDRYDHVIGINLTSPDITHLADVLEAIDGRAELHVGGPVHALTALALGATGYLSSEGNLAPRRCMALIEAWRTGDQAASATVYAELLRLFRATQAAGGIVGTKAALRALGTAGGWPRPPRRTPDDAAVTDLLAVIEELGLADDEELRRRW